MQLSIKALRYFLVAAELNSIARAAEKLNVVPSAISTAIENVENEFELKLLQRFPAKGIRPTSSGVKIMQKIRHLVEEYDNLFIEGAELRNALSGHISIGYYAPVAPAFIPAVIEPLLRDNENITVSLKECNNEQAQTGLLNGEFDVIVFVAENVRTGIKIDTLLEASPYILVSSNHEFVRRQKVTFDEIRGEPMIFLDLAFTNEYYRGLLEANSIDVKSVVTASTTEMVRSLVGAGIGIALLNMQPLTKVSYAGDELVAIPIKSKTKPLTLVIGHLTGNRRRLVESFSKSCCEYFSDTQSRELIVEH